MRVIFMGTPEFAVPALMAISNGGFELAAIYTREPARGGRRGLEIRKTPVHEAADSLGVPVFTPRTLRDAEVQKAFRESRRGRRRCLGLRPHSAGSRSRSAEARLSQPARLPVAALARRGADSAGDHGRRHGNGRRRHADGGRPRHRAGWIARNHPHSPRRHGRRSDAPPFCGRRPARGQRPQGARSRPIVVRATARRRRLLRPQNREERGGDRLDSSLGDRPQLRSTGSRPRPAPFPGS